MSKQKIGPIQEKWIQGLEKNPEQQMYHGLGLRKEGYDMFCILGKGLESCGRAEFDEDGKLRSDGTMLLNKEDVEHLGLFDNAGVFQEEVFVGVVCCCSLSALNDNGVSWKKIAEYMRENPGNVFKESK